MTINADVLIAGSGTMANLLAMYFADAGKRVSMSAYRPYPQVLQDGMGLECATEGRRKIAVQPQDIFLNPFKNPIQPGQIGIFVRTRDCASQDLCNLTLENDKLVAFATKTFSNPQVIEDLKPVLQQTSDLTFFTTQNGVHPEIEIDDLLESNGIRDFRLFRGIAQGGAFPIKQGVFKHTINRYSLGCWGKDQSDQEFLKGLKEIKENFSQETIPAEICLGDYYKINSAHKAIANTLNSICFLFSARVEEILDHEPLRKFTEDKNYETIRIARDNMGLDLDVEETKKNSFRMYEALRPHYPSMAVDAFRSFFNPRRKLDTEIKHLDRQFINYSKQGAFLNTLCTELVEDFTQAFNEIRDKSYRRAVMFGLRFMTRNRVVAGLPPYRFFKVPIARMVEREEWIKRYVEDTELETGSTYTDIFSKIAVYYSELKRQHAKYLTKLEFEYTVTFTQPQKTFVACSPPAYARQTPAV